ncbi:MAG: hypothetical protein IJ688_09300 [Treponema sp.]|nr:hypothetical protein [Treponema sp.]
MKNNKRNWMQKKRNGKGLNSKKDKTLFKRKKIIEIKSYSSDIPDESTIVTISPNGKVVVRKITVSNGKRIVSSGKVFCRMKNKGSGSNNPGPGVVSKKKPSTKSSGVGTVAKDKEETSTSTIGPGKQQ